MTSNLFLKFFTSLRSASLLPRISYIAIYILSDNNFHTPQSRKNMSLAVEETARIYQNNPNFIVTEARKNARVPICVIKYIDRSGRHLSLMMDHSYLDGLGVHFNKTINHWLSMHNEEPRKLLSSLVITA